MTLNDYRQRAEKFLGKSADAIKQLGKVLIDAKRDLPPEEYNELRLHLKNLGMDDLLLAAAVAIAEEKLDARLVFAGARTHDVLNLTPTDQVRLLSEEKFELARPDGSTAKKSWGEMKGWEKAQLLRSGGITPPELQLKSSSGIGRKSRQSYTSAAIVESSLVLIYNSRQGEIDISTLAAALNRSGQLEKFIEALRVQLPTTAAAA